MEMGQVRTDYKPTDLMISDVLTKPKSGEGFRMLRNMLLNMCQSVSAALQGCVGTGSDSSASGQSGKLEESIFCGG